MARSENEVLRPVQANERIVAVDILRGFAILGILVANMAGYSGLASSFQQQGALLDRAVLLLTRFLVEAKFYSLFSFLFGWGLAVQMSRAKAKGTPFVPLYCRRLLFLALFGAAHAWLIWSGDILILYALVGALVLALRNRSNRFLLAAAGFSLLFGLVLALPGQTMETFRTWYGEVTAPLRRGTLPEGLYLTGSYLEVTRLRFQDYFSSYSGILYSLGSVLAMFLVGLYAGKREILQQSEAHLPLIRRVFWVGLIAGATLNGLYAYTTVDPTVVPIHLLQMVQRGSRIVGAPALMLCYVTGILLVIRRPGWRLRLAPLAPVGRTALSNYLGQSLVATLIFYGYALGAYGRTDPVLNLLLTLTIFAGQVHASGWWLARYRFGPAEWLWRSLTYGRLQPMRQRVGNGHAVPIQHAGRIATLMRRVDARRALLATWALLLLWGTGLGIWYMRLEAENRSTGTQVAKAPGVATATPVADRSPVGARAETIATPVVEPMVYDPGPVAAAGDLLALAGTFDVEEAWAEIELLTGPPYLGRYTGSPQAWAAGDAIASQFAAYGLQPAGDDGTYFQSFPVYFTNLTEVPRLTVENAAGAVHDDYQLNKDYTPILRWYGGGGSGDGDVVWANKCEARDLDQIEVTGRIVLCRDDAVTLLDAQRNVVERGADALLLWADPAQRPADMRTTHREVWIPEPIPVLRVYPPFITDLLAGSGMSPEDLALRYTTVALPASVQIEVTTTGPEACPSDGCQGRNVLGVIPGRDPAYADQVIILGAHYDHLGETPDGTVWPGANDNASGVATMLEIARSWHEQGYVPRTTVLFAAWDAEEVGLLGSIHYVQHPRYPLDQTMAMIQLDMVGAGSDTLYIDGRNALGEEMTALAQSMGLPAELADVGRSDHAPFLEAGVPACLLIWFGPGDSLPEYHRPADTAASIELDKLAASGQLANLALLGMTEGEPAIRDLLARRTAALQAQDLAAFLATSTPEQAPADERWFQGAWELAEGEVTLSATEIRVWGPTASATIGMTFKPGEGQEVHLTLDAQFTHTADSWRWDGPNLARIEPATGTGFAVAFPPGDDMGMAELGRRATERYMDLARRLDLSTRPAGVISLLPDQAALRASISPALAPDASAWVEPGMIKLVQEPEIAGSAVLDEALIQLLLADAGVVPEAAPWLWRGLPMALQTANGGLASDAERLAGVQRALTAETNVENAWTAWAAVDFVQRQAGWEGVGQLITLLGEACRQGRCVDRTGIDAALTAVLGMDNAALATAWRAGWGSRLEAMKSGLDTVLAARNEALARGDLNGFLATVDPAVPGLIAEERHWFESARTLERITLTGNLLAAVDDGVLAEVTVGYEPAGTGSPRSTVVTALLTGEGGSARWAGIQQASLVQGTARVLFQPGMEALAPKVLHEAVNLYAELADILGAEQPAPLILKLYDEPAAYRASIAPDYPDLDWPAGWTSRDAPIKLLLNEETPLNAIRSALAMQLSSKLMAQSALEPAWLAEGAAIYLAGRTDGGRAERAAAANLRQLAQGAAAGTLPSLAEAAGQAGGLEATQVWDAVRYLVDLHGWGAVQEVLRGESTLAQVTGQTDAQFEAAWLESLQRGHALPGWIETANAFDPARAEVYVSELASEAYSGRQAGSPGAEAAADAIAEHFAEYGLLPLGDDGSYLQRFPITYTTLLAPPQLGVAGAGELSYRTDFTLVNAPGSGGSAAGELVWVGNYQAGEMDLHGKVVLRVPATAIEDEMAQAAERGAAGLVLIGTQEREKELLAKTPLPITLPTQPALPTVELSTAGSAKLLESMGISKAELASASPAMPLGLEAHLAIPASPPEQVMTANVLGWIPGSDPQLADEVIVVGAHYDHVGDDPGPASPERRYSGANDNASGVAVLLEMARLWQERGYRPARSIILAAWGAQELGQLGSAYYVNHPARPLARTMAMINLDALAGGEGYYLEAQGEWENDGLLLFGMMTAERWVDGRLSIKDHQGNNDHVPFQEAGIPTLLITWREASEANWPAPIANPVESYRLGVAGRMVTLAVMGLAR
jgi:uncharacterized protein